MLITERIRFVLISVILIFFYFPFYSLGGGSHGEGSLEQTISFCMSFGQYQYTMGPSKSG